MAGSAGGQQASVAKHNDEWERMINGAIHAVFHSDLEREV